MCGQTSSYGNAGGRITARIAHGVLWLKLEEDPQGPELEQCLRDVIADGWLKQGVPTLVDMLGFNGNIDWGAIRKIREMIPWIGEAPGDAAIDMPVGQKMPREGMGTGGCRVGYVTRDPMFGSVLRIICDLLGSSRHRQFRDVETALLWVCRHDSCLQDEV